MPSITYIILLILLIRVTFKVVIKTIMNKIGNPCKCMNCKNEKEILFNNNTTDDVNNTVMLS